MGDSAVLYAGGSILVVLCVLLIFVGLQNIIKIIFGNYILGTICFAASIGIDGLVDTFQGLPDQTFVGLSGETWARFLSNGHATIILLLYIFLLIVLYKKSTLSIRIPFDSTAQKGLYVVLVPLALTSVILTLYILLRGSGVISPIVLQTWASSHVSLSVLSQVFALTPLWVVIHGLVTLLISSEFSMSVDTDIGDFGDV